VNSFDARPALSVDISWMRVGSLPGRSTRRCHRGQRPFARRWASQFRGAASGCHPTGRRPRGVWSVRCQDVPFPGGSARAKRPWGAAPERPLC